MNIIFDSSLLPFTNTSDLIEVEAGTVKEALVAVFNRYPQLYVHIAGDGVKGSTLALVHNDSAIIEATDYRMPLSADDTLHFLEVPYGAAETAAAAFTMIVAELMPVAVAVAVVDALVLLAINLAVQLIMSAIMGALSDDIAAPDANMGVNNSATYTFDGVKNTTYSGAPIGIVYGCHRVGGNILNVFTSEEFQQNLVVTDLHVQIGLCEGEVESISDVYINKMPAKFYNAVAIPEVRYGEETQKFMPNFNKIENTTSIARKISNLSEKLAQTTSTVGTPAVAYGVVENGQITGTSTYYKIPRVWVGPDIGGGPGEG